MNRLFPTVLACLALTIGPAKGQDATSGAGPAVASLAQAYEKHFSIGVAVGGRVPQDYSAEEIAIVERHFNVLTPENSMKMDHVQREEGKFDFEQADAFVEYAQGRKADVVGHTLVWARDEATPAWFYKDGDKPVGRELLLERMRAHIHAVAGRYKGKVAQWDVVNEALDDGDGDGVYLRQSGWLKGAGPDFIAKAFEYAHEAAPDAMLIYNDYGTEQPAKRKRMLRLLRTLRDRKAPVHAVGLQGHFELDQVPLKELDETLTAIKGLGLKVVFSELDLGVVPRGRWWADGGKHRAELATFDPYKDGCPPDVLARQAAQYAELFELFRKHAEVIDRVTFWGVHDGRSWLNGFPWNHTEHPLLFDRASRPKPAFDAVIEAAR